MDDLEANIREINFQLLINLIVEISNEIPAKRTSRWKQGNEPIKEMQGNFIKILGTLDWKYNTSNVGLPMKDSR